MNNVTLQDVAQAAGVSLATVSRALHGGYVSAEKRRRIEEAVRTLRYIPNQSAAALKRNRSRTIGHLMHFHDNLLASRVNAGLARAAHERGYSLFSVTSNGGGEDSRRMAEELISRRMDGMVVTSCRDLPAETTAHLADVGIPTVLIERWAPGAMGDRIRIDDVAGARCAVAQRLAAGRKRVAFIGCGDFSQEVERQRLWGYREALESAGVPEEIRLIRLTEDYTPEEGRRAMEALLESGGCDAVFCASDLLAAGVLQSLYRRSIRVPDQIAVTGYDNTVSAMLSPQISSVALDCDEIGRQAMALLLRRMEDPALEEKEITILPTLIARD